MAVETAWLSALEPRLSAALAVQQLNGGEAAFYRLRLFEAYRFTAHGVVVLLLVLLALGLVRPLRKGEPAGSPVCSFWPLAPFSAAV